MPSKHRDYIAIERDAGQEVQVTIGEARAGRAGDHEPIYIGQTTAGGRDIDGGFTQVFNRVLSSGIYAALSLPARAVYTALAYLADNTRCFVVDGGYGGRAGSGVNIERIMAVSGCGETAAKKAMKELVDRQLVRVLRKGGSRRNGQRVASIYQLLLPVDGYEALHVGQNNANRPGRDTTGYGIATRPGTAAQGDPVPPREATRFPGATRSSTAAPRARTTRKSNKPQNSKSPRAAAAKEKADPEKGNSLADGLAARGVGEPLLSRLLEEAEPETIRRHLLDFDIRNRLQGAKKKSPGWLGQSILVPYDLHEETLRTLEQEQRSAGAKVAARRREVEDALEQERLVAIEAWVEEQFAEMEDDELSAWKARALDRFPPLTRGLVKADPRTNERLVRLIKGMLAELCPYAAEVG